LSVNQLTGALTLIGTPAAIGSGVTADPSGKFVYVVANSGMTDNLVTYTINPATGALTPAGGTPVILTTVTTGAISGELQF
jgi:DNA-binding beta-propeller fold protein YncE